jgi:hypothetical protein
MENNMQLSQDTIAVLTNFGSINSNIVLRPGQQLKTISEAKNILAVADIVEDFPADMGIYDLNEFLSTYSLVDDATLVFEDNSVQIKNNTNKVKFYFAEPSILTTPDKDITMPSCEVNVVLTEEMLSKTKKAASVLGHTDVAIIGDDESISVKVFDTKDSSANTFETELGPNTTGHKFSFVMNISNMKIIDGEYDVQISSKLISKWTNKNKPISYFIALEKSSSFGV